MTTARLTPAPPGPPPTVVERWRALRRESRADRWYRGTLTVVAWLLPALLVVILVELIVGAWPAITTFGMRFLTRSIWDPVASEFGVLPLIVGTLYVSAVAMVIAVPLAVGSAIFLTEFAPRRLRAPVAALVELLAAVPSVIYGLWGLFVLIPLLRETIWPVVKPALSWLPFFEGAFYGPSILAAGIILAIMVLPYVAAVSREVLLAVPAAQREAALALGATRWEAVWTVILPYGRAGIFGAVILGLGRALGETMAVTMLIGNRHEIGLSVVQPGYTIAAAIANEFAEAVTSQHQSALVYAGLVLFVITVIINAVARWLIWRVAKGSAAGSAAL